jgi:SAM-dependent methyltransferase
MDADLLSIEIQRRLARAENYNAWIYRLLAPHLGHRILEAGCSIGNFIPLFLDRDLVATVDISPDAIRLLLETVGNRSNLQARVLDLAGDDVLELAHLQLDTVVCLNVLEHIADDQHTLRNFFQILRLDGRLLLYVPALRRLYGSMDVSDHHFRRYGRAELVAKGTTAGFRIEDARFVNLIGMFG